MSDKNGERKGKGKEDSGADPGASPQEELVPLREGRYGAAWFVMLVGMMMVAYFYLNLVFYNVIAVKDVLDRYEGPSVWVRNMAPWLADNAMLLALGSALFLVGYSMTLRRRGRFSTERLMLRLFGVGTGFIALALLVLGVDYLFFLPKELQGLSAHLDLFGIQLSAFLVWFAALSAVTVYCWLPKGGSRDGEEDPSGKVA